MTAHPHKPETSSVEIAHQERLDIAYMRMAFGLAAASGFERSFGPVEQVDVPFAAVGTSNGTVVARGVASDNLLQVDGVHADAHAEGMLIQNFFAHEAHEQFPLDTVYTTFEPCRVCLKALYEQLPDLKKVYYGTERSLLEQKGDVNVRPTVHQYAQEWGIDLDIEQFDKDERLRRIGERMLDSFSRDRANGLVIIDRSNIARLGLEIRQLAA